MPRSEESSNQSGASSSSLQARTTFGQSFCATWPLRSLSPEIRARQAMKRCASSTSDISSEKKATGMSLLDRDVFGDVGDQRALAHRRPCGDDDQVAGLEAAGDRVDVAEAGGGAGQLGLAGRELLEPVDLVVEDLREEPEVAGLLFVGDFEEQLLGPLGELARLAVALVDPALDLLAGAEQPAQQRVLLDDLGVVLGVAGGRDLGRQLGDVVLAARLLDLVALGQRLADAQLVDRLGGRVEVVDAARRSPRACRGRSPRRSASPRR